MTNGTRIIVLDDNGWGFLYSVVSPELCEIVSQGKGENYETRFCQLIDRAIKYGYEIISHDNYLYKKAGIFYEEPIYILGGKKGKPAKLNVPPSLANAVCEICLHDQCGKKRCG